MTLRDNLHPVNIGLLLLLAAATIAGFVLVSPTATLPIHWGVTGAADGFLPRDEALLLFPVLALTLAIVLIFVRRFGDPDASRHAVRVAVSCVLALFTVLQVAIVMIGTGIAVDMVRVVVLLVGALFVVIGNVLPKTQPNPIAGIRLPWTIHDPANWQATNRLGGIAMMLGGAVIVIAALLTGASATLLTLTIGVVLLSVLVPTIYSWRLSRAK